MLVDPNALDGAELDDAVSVATRERFRARAIIGNFRKLRGWTQQEAADWYGVSVRSWRRWERYHPPRHLLNRIEQYAKRTGGDAIRWLT